jgi:D-arabinose 1-dehydrogenase-like Zn-dependent alcohol dehydrogenase
VREFFFAHKQIRGTLMGDVADLEWGLQLVAKRQVKPLLDRTLPLAQAANAHQLIAENRVRGNLVLLPWAA